MSTMISLILIFLSIVPTATALQCHSCSSVSGSIPGNNETFAQMLNMENPMAECPNSPTTMVECSSLCVTLNAMANVEHIILPFDEETITALTKEGVVKATIMGCLSTLVDTEEFAWVEDLDTTTNRMCGSSSGDVIGMRYTMKACVCASDGCNTAISTTSPAVGTAMGEIVDSDFTGECPVYDIEDECTADTTAMCSNSANCTDERSNMCCTKQCKEQCVEPFYARPFTAIHCSQVHFENLKNASAVVTDADWPKVDLNCMESPVKVITKNQCKALAVTLNVKADLTNLVLPSGVESWIKSQSIDYTDDDMETIESIMELGQMHMVVRACLEAMTSETYWIPKLPIIVKEGGQCINAQAGNIFGATFEAEICGCNTPLCNGKAIPMLKRSTTMEEVENQVEAVHRVPGVPSWSSWATNNMEECCAVDSVAIAHRTRFCQDAGTAGCPRSDGTFGTVDTMQAPCTCVPIHGNWSEWLRDTTKGSCCAEGGKEWYIRYCNKPQPRWGGLLCTKTSEGMGTIEYMTKNCKCNVEQEETEVEIAKLMANPEYLPGNVAFALTYAWTILIPVCMATVVLQSS